MSRGPWIRTFSGLRFYPLDPQPEEVRLTDICHSLSMIARFGGHLPQFYSVAEHSFLVAKRVKELGGSTEEILWGLFHDAAEAYIGDIPRPLKRLVIPQIKTVEDRILSVIAERFGLEYPVPIIVKFADEELIAAEVQYYWGISLDEMAEAGWMINCSSIPSVSISGMHPSVAMQTLHHGIQSSLMSRG